MSGPQLDFIAEITDSRDTAELTRLLMQWKRNDRVARDHFFELTYNNLRRIAQNLFRMERTNHTLQPTAVVNEAWEKLDQASAKVEWQNRSHFFATARLLMKQVLVEHHRQHVAKKRGGGKVPCSLDEVPHSVAGKFDETLLELEGVFFRLEKLDQSLVTILDLRDLQGLSREECATATGLSISTVDRRLKVGRAWIQREFCR